MIDLHIVREERTALSTLGKIYLNGQWLFWTLEEGNGELKDGEYRGRFAQAHGYNTRMIYIVHGSVDFLWPVLAPLDDLAKPGDIVLGGARILNCTRTEFGVSHTTHARRIFYEQIRAIVAEDPLAAIRVAVVDPLKRVRAS